MLLNYHTHTSLPFRKRSLAWTVLYHTIRLACDRVTLLIRKSIDCINLDFTSAVTRLEQKLDGVASLLAAAQRDSARDSAREVGRKDQDSAGSWSEPAEAEAGERAIQSPTLCLQRHFKDDGEAELILDVFRTDMALHFPFVVIPPTTGLDELRQKRPFVLMNALMVACRHDRTRQAALAKTFRDLLSQRVLLPLSVSGELGFDLFQGLLLYLSWYHLNLQVGPHLTSLVHLAMAMLTDLGLNRPGLTAPRSLSNRIGPYLVAYDRPASAAAAATLDERRAFLGCFCLTFIVSMCARDIVPLRYTKYADECCHLISEAAEYETDLYLVRLTQQCRLGDRMSRTLSPDECEWESGSDFSFSAPIGACVKMFEAELQRLKASTLQDLSAGESEGARSQSQGQAPCPPTTTSLLTIFHHGMEMFLYETALDDSIHPARYGMFPLTRLDMLFACLTATKSCLEAFLNLPAPVWFDMSYLLWGVVGHAFVVMSKLSLFVGEGWDQDYARTVLHFPTMVDTVAAKVSAAEAEAEAEAEAAAELSRALGFQEHEAGVSRPFQEHNAGVDPAAARVVLPRAVPKIFASVPPKAQRMKEVYEMRRSRQACADNSPPSLGPPKPRTRTSTEESSSSFPAAPSDEHFIPGLTGLFDFLDEDFWQQQFT
ncbi:hypothetical protein A1O3_04410 [Capronia epimyces CBS 606.96]|uniref:Transcription factor domain-containing protein n=1 Tax=Capronia epimyces CBS 606.96 TaxID=1182542 RepID=W9YCS1_9EURO|nr:uncharacterized protein A1O3_04410 [Capronia epimyces CBS 606.96]EXJ87450.1 hypothetical protein A1O3_04410 [Capronia epimyces CBS 606.96]